MVKFLFDLVMVKCICFANVIGDGSMDWFCFNCIDASFPPSNGFDAATRTFTTASSAAPAFAPGEDPENGILVAF